MEQDKLTKIKPNTKDTFYNKKIHNLINKNLDLETITKDTNDKIKQRSLDLFLPSHWPPKILMENLY